MTTVLAKTILLGTGCAAMLMLLAGCATLTREQCLQGDWYGIGVADGQQGRTLERLDGHRRACRDTPAVVDEAAYRAGRDIGLVSYCTPVSGYRVAEGGRRYAGVCPVAIEPRFMAGFVLGEQVRETRLALSTAESRLADLERELEAKRDEVVAIEEEIAGYDDRYDISGPERTLRMLRREARALREDVLDARYAVERARETLADVQARTSLQLQALQS